MKNKKINYKNNNNNSANNVKFKNHFYSMT